MVVDNPGAAAIMLHGPLRFDLRAVHILFQPSENTAADTLGKLALSTCSHDWRRSESCLPHGQPGSLNLCNLHLSLKCTGCNAAASIHPCIHLSIQPPINPSIHPVLPPSNQPHPFINPLIHPCLHASLPPCLQASKPPSLQVSKWPWQDAGITSGTKHATCPFLLLWG